MEFIESQAVIEEVKKYPCLYDPNDKSFRNRDVRRDAWMVATTAIVGIENWEVMGDRDKEATVANVQKRWKGIKDSFMKSIRTQNATKSTSGKTRRPYVFHKKMTFLQPFLTPKEDYLGIIEDEEEAVSSRDSSPTPTSSNVDPTLTTLKRKAECDDDTFEMKVLDILKAKVESASRPPRPDPDEMFLLSQIPTIKQMRLEQKIDFQVKFIHLVQDCFKRQH